MFNTHSLGVGLFWSVIKYVPICDPMFLEQIEPVVVVVTIEEISGQKKETDSLIREAFTRSDQIPAAYN